MKKFQDMQGREWQIVITIGSAIRIKDKLGIDLLQFENQDQSKMTSMFYDVLVLGNIISLLLEDQFEKNGVVEKHELMDAFDGQTLLAAKDAFYEEVLDFFQLRGREDYASVVRKMLGAVQSAIDAAKEKYEALDVVAVVSGVMSGELPEASELTPEVTH